MAKTTAEKQRERNSGLDAKARAAGFAGWSDYGTQVLRGHPLIRKGAEFAPVTPPQLACSVCGAQGGALHKIAGTTGLYCKEHCPECQPACEHNDDDHTELSIVRRCSVCGEDTGMAHYSAEDTIYCRQCCPTCAAKECAE